MTCKDCFHYEACKSQVPKSFWSENNNDDCNLFKDKNKIIESPCKVGDIAYIINEGEIIPRLVVAVEKNLLGIKVRTNRDEDIYTHSENLFFNEADAENKLKGGKI